jgi:hypothetical protein
MANAESEQNKDGRSKGGGGRETVLSESLESAIGTKIGCDGPSWQHDQSERGIVFLSTDAAPVPRSAF